VDAYWLGEELLWHRTNGFAFESFCTTLMVTRTGLKAAFVGFFRYMEESPLSVALENHDTRETELLFFRHFSLNFETELPSGMTNKFLAFILISW
jgi:hypothetical protein